MYIVILVVTSVKYDAVDVRRFEEDDVFAWRFLLHCKSDLKLALTMLDSSLQFRKQFALNGE